MPHCFICNFCETTPGSSLDPLESRANNKVKFYPDLNLDLCTVCRDSKIAICTEYYDELPPPTKEELIEPESIPEDTPALSEV